MIKQRLLFVTTSSLAANPRLVKEFECLKLHFKCYVLCFEHIDWTQKLSNDIMENNPEVNFIVINRRQNFFRTLISKLKHKLALLLNPYFKSNSKILAYASNDKSPQLHSAIKVLSNKHKFDRVIAHNLGAFYPAVKYSVKTSCQLHLDVEDYHPGEALYFNKKYEKKNREFLMQYSFNYADYITYASNGIANKCQKTYSISSEAEQETILNSFSLKEFKKPKQNKNRITKCVWFSQNIGPNRGLEQVFSAAKNHLDVEFHLIGNKDNSFLENIELANNIYIHKTMSQEKLHIFLSGMDIGLALENKKADYNRDICLTNKFLAYLQSGLYIYATDTNEQTDFLSKINYDAGLTIQKNLSESLSNFSTRVLSFENKIERLEKAKAYSWENEKAKLLKLFK